MKKPEQSADGQPVPFQPVPVRRRHDGWTAQRQTDFIAALADSGCVAEAAAQVKLSASAAYRLYARPDAYSFRAAWDAALDIGVRRLSDAVLSRAIHGTATPIMYKGEQVGERRTFDNRLATFILRYRDPVRYGKWRDTLESRRHPEGPAAMLALATLRMDRDALCDESGMPRPARDSGRDVEDCDADDDFDADVA